MREQRSHPWRHQRVVGSERQFVPGPNCCRQLLDAPVVHIRNEKLVPRGTSIRISPVELLLAASRFAKRAKELAVKCQLADPSRFAVRRVQVLCRRTRDADGPRLGQIGSAGCEVSEYRVPLLVVPRIVVAEPLEIAIAIEHLETTIVPIRDVQVVLPGNADAVQRVEPGRVLVCLRAARSSGTSGCGPIVVLVVLRDSRVTVAVADESVWPGTATLDDHYFITLDSSEERPGIRVGMA